jgi:plastocyanin
MLRSFSLLLAGGAIALAGCGSSNSSSDSTAASTPAAATPAASGSTIAIHLKNIAFSPTTVTAKVGQTIKWTNDDSVDHNVTATKGESFKSDNFGQGGTYSYKLDKAGTITYVCTLHSGMTATINVQ